MPSLFLRLKRVTSGATWIPEIDGLRFVAIFSVVIFHLGGQMISKSGHVWTSHEWYLPIVSLMSNGARGVELFFVISGFILGRPFARYYLMGENRVSLRSYFMRRITRLEPPYLLNLILCAIAIYFYVHTPVRQLMAHLLASAVYGHDLLYGAPSTLNAVTWSLEIEIQFYILVPVLVLVYRIRSAYLRRGILITAMLLFSSLQRYLFTLGLWDKPAGLFYSTVFFYLQYFLAGLLLSDLYLTCFPNWRPSRWWDLASLICWPAYFYFSLGWPPTWMPFLLIVNFIGAFHGIYFPRLFRVEAIALIGGMCYSIYLWHFFVIALGSKLTRNLVWTHDYFVNLFIQSALLLPLVLLWSTLYYVAVERPCMDPQWPQKLLRKIKAAPADAGAA